MEKNKNNEKNGKVKNGKSTYLISDKERNLLLGLRDNPEGIRVATIKKLTSLPTRTIYNILEKYSKKNLIENIYPIWKPINGQSDFWQTLSKGNNIFELHNLSYILKLIKKPDWWNKRKPRLMRLKGWEFSNHNFGKNNSNPYQQLINEDYVIQTYPESITIMHRKRFYTDNPYELLEQGIIKTLEIIQFLEERFKFKFLQNGIPALEMRGSHFNRLRDYLANKCKSDGRRFLVKTEVGDCWVDYSEPFGKEADTPDIQDTLERVTKDHIEKKPMLNSELQSAIREQNEQIGRVTENQLMFNKNFESHVKSIRQLGNSAESNAKSTELLAETILKMKESFELEINKLNEEIKRLRR